MIRRIYPGRAEGVVQVPASKSICHRALIAAALAEGKSVLTNVDMSKDIEATIACLQSLGADITVNGTTVAVTGGSLKTPTKPLFCGESGSTLRFLLPTAALLDDSVQFTGAGRLMQRPQTVYEEVFAQKGVDFTKNDDSVIVKGPLTGGAYSVRGDISSQFITGLLFALPLAKEDSVLTVLPPYESRSYVDITVAVLRSFGVLINDTDPMRLVIKGGQSFMPCDYTVDGDDSQSAFLSALGVLCGDVACTGLSSDSKQGDRVMIDYLRQMGADITKTNNGFIAKKSMLHGGTFHIEDCPDIGPILMTCCAFADSPSVLTGIRRLRIKESDRVAAMKEELEKLGTVLTAHENSIEIVPTTDPAGGCSFNGHNDHRIVMSMAVASVAAKCPCTINGAEAVQKSYPKFFEDLAATGIVTEEEKTV